MEKKKEQAPKFTPDPEACKLVAEAFEDIKKKIPDLTMNVSALGSFIVKGYFKRQLLKKDQPRIEEAFFNKRKYLKRVLEEKKDIDEAIQRLASLSVKKKKK